MADQTTKRFDEGLSVRRQVLGTPYVDNALSEAEGDPMGEELQQMVTEFGWGVVWTRPGLSLKTRSMLNLATLTALNHPHESQIHLRGAINNGVTRDEVKEILFQAAVYCGWAAAIDSFRIAKGIFSEIDSAESPTK